MSFRLVPKSVTLNDLERRNGVILRCFNEFGYLLGALRKSSRSLSHLLISSCVSLGHPANFNGFHVLASVLQCRCSMKANQTLHDVWLPPGLVHYTYIFGGSCPVPRNGILPGATSALHPNLALSYFGSVTARH